MNDSQSSCTEDIGYAINSNIGKHHKSLTKLSSKNRSCILNSNRSSEPNCESDSEGILTSRAIGRLSLKEHKRSFESDHGAPMLQNTPKKSTRRRRKPKNSSIPMQVDDGAQTLKSSFRREKRSLGKRKRWSNIPPNYSIKKHPSTKMDLNLEMNSLSDGESVESFLSGKTTEAYLSQEDTAADGDDEQSDWCQDITLTDKNIVSVTPVFEEGSYFNHINSNPVYSRNSRHLGFIKSCQNKSNKGMAKDDFLINSSTFNRFHCRSRSIKTGNRRLLTNSTVKSVSVSSTTMYNSNIYHVSPVAKHLCYFPKYLDHPNNIKLNSRNNNNITSHNNDFDKPKRYSSKRLRCGSASLNSTTSHIIANETFAESENPLDVGFSCDLTQDAWDVNTSIFYQNGRPPSKKGATEKLIFGKIN